MNIYKRINTETLKLAVKADYGIGAAMSHKAAAYSDRWTTYEHDDFALEIVAERPEIDEDTQQLKRLEDLILPTGEAWTITTNRFEVVDKVEVVPFAVSMAQLREQLIRQGLKASVEAAIAAISDDTTKAIVIEWWEYSAEVHRDSAKVASLASALGLNDSFVDSLFLSASKIVG